MAPAVRCSPQWHLGSGAAASEPDLTWRTAGAEGRSRSARYSKSCRARAPSRVSQGTLDTHSSPGSCHTQTHTRHQAPGLHCHRRCAAQKKGMETHGALIAVIGDEETVTGMLLAGVGNVDARRTSNFMVVDSSARPPLTAAALPPASSPLPVLPRPQRRHRRRSRTPSSGSPRARTSPSCSSTNMCAAGPVGSAPSPLC